MNKAAWEKTKIELREFVFYFLTPLCIGVGAIFFINNIFCDNLIV